MTQVGKYGRHNHFLDQKERKTATLQSQIIHFSRYFFFLKKDRFDPLLSFLAIKIENKSLQVQRSRNKE
jgi:hypothetical protein